jgi:hypothetical protein
MLGIAAKAESCIWINNKLQCPALPIHNKVTQKIITRAMKNSLYGTMKKTTKNGYKGALLT